MKESAFWEIVHESFSGTTNDLGLASLESRLLAMDRGEVEAFEQALNSAMAAANNWTLIGAACFIGVGQSDDGFEDFRAWLVSRGHVTYSRVLEDPEYLAGIQYHVSPTDEWYLEGFYSLPGEIGEEKFGDWPYTKKDLPTGEPTELTQETLADRYPVLWERFGNRFMIGIS